MPYAAASSASLHRSPLVPHGQVLLSDHGQLASFFTRPPPPPAIQPDSVPTLQEVQLQAAALHGRDASASTMKAVTGARATFGDIEAARYMSLQWMQPAAAAWAAAAYGNWQPLLMWANWMGAFSPFPSRAPSPQLRTPVQKSERPVTRVRHEPCWPDCEDFTCSGRLRVPIPKVNGKNATLLCCPRENGRLLSREDAKCGRSAANGTVITGTGRAGTTFLMAVLSDLGLPTGYDSADADTAIATNWHAGLELRTLKSCYCAHDDHSLCIDWNTDVEIFKGPSLAEQAQHPLWLSLPQNSNLADVILPVRDHDAAAASRADNGLQNGGWTDGVRTVEEQRAASDRRLGELMPALAKADVRVTTLLYPHHVLDENYTATKLSWLLERYAIPRERFVAAHCARRKVPLIHHHDLLPELIGAVAGSSLRTVPTVP